MDKECHAYCFAHLGQVIDRAYKLRIKETEEFDRIMSIEDPEKRKKELKAFEPNTSHETFLLLYSRKLIMSRLYHAEKICQIYSISPEETLAIRQKVSLPLFLQLCDLFEELTGSSIKSSQNGKRACYFQERKEIFGTYLENNSLFAQTYKGASRLAITASVAMTAVQNDLNPVRYFKFLFETLKPYLVFDENYQQWWLDISEEELIKVLPWSQTLPKEVFITRNAFEKAQQRALMASAQ